MRRLTLSLPVALALVLASAPALAVDQSVSSCCAASTQTNEFRPKSVTVNVGETVTWTNEAGGFHNVKFDDGSFEEPAQSDPSPWVVKRTFNTAGEFGYYCEEHGNRGGVGMAGTVIVGGGAPPPPGGDTTDPDLDSLRVSPSTFCNKKSKSCPTTGARIRFTLSEAATVELTVLRRKEGTVVKVFSVKAKAGKNSVKYSGKGLPNGKYVLQVTAADAAGNRSAPAKTSFKIAKKR
jgi:plastocyanin